MEHRKAALSLLFLAVLVSGCGDSGTQSEGSNALNVEGPDFSRGEIFAGSDINIRMSIENAGQMQGTLRLGDQGGKIMTDYCRDIFSIQDFQNRSTGEEVDEGVPGFRLEPGEDVNMNWILKADDGNVPLNGYTCDVKFRAPFDYSVASFRQIQVKKPGAASGEPELASKSSTGPMKINIETAGSSSERGAPVFLEGDNIKVLIQFVNKEPEEGAYRGLMEIEKPEVEASNGDLSGCQLESIRLTEGKSQVFECGLDVSLDDVPSKKAEISVSADYTYIRNLGSKSVKVRNDG